MAGTTLHFSLFKKCHTNCVPSLPRLKSLTSKCVILDPKTNSSLKIHAHRKVTVVQCAAEVQPEFRFKPRLFGQTEKPLGGRGEQMKTKMGMKFGDEFWPSEHHLQYLKKPEPPPKTDNNLHKKGVCG